MCRRSRNWVTTSWRPTGSRWSGPARLPDDIADKVNREVNVATSKPESQKRMRADGMLIHGMDTAAFRKFLADEHVTWKPVIEKAGMIPK